MTSQTHTLELDFQAALLAALNAPGRATRVHRQNVGTVLRRDRRGRDQGVFHAGPPKGAADLCGLVGPDGLHLEVECKSASAPWTPAQHRWCDFIRGRGGVYVLVRFDERFSLELNVAIAVADIDGAIEDRRIDALRIRQDSTSGVSAIFGAMPEDEDEQTEEPAA